MKFLALIIALAVIYMVFYNQNNPQKSVDEAMKEASAVNATPAARGTPLIVGGNSQPQPAQPSSGLRRPIDTTRQVLDQVKGRNGNGEF